MNSNFKVDLWFMVQCKLPVGFGMCVFLGDIMLVWCMVHPLRTVVKVCEAASQHLVRLSAVT